MQWQSRSLGQKTHPSVLVLVSELVWSSLTVLTACLFMLLFCLLGSLSVLLKGWGLDQCQPHCPELHAATLSGVL